MNLLLYLTHSIVCVCMCAIKQQSENNHGGPTLNAARSLIRNLLDSAMDTHNVKYFSGQ